MKLFRVVLKHKPPHCRVHRFIKGFVLAKDEETALACFKAEVGEKFFETFDRTVGGEYPYFVDIRIEEIKPNEAYIYLHEW